MPAITSHQFLVLIAAFTYSYWMPFTVQSNKLFKSKEYRNYIDTTKREYSWVGIVEKGIWMVWTILLAAEALVIYFLLLELDDFGMQFVAGTAFVLVTVGIQKLWPFVVYKTIKRPWCFFVPTVVTLAFTVMAFGFICDILAKDQRDGAIAAFVLWLLVVLWELFASYLSYVIWSSNKSDGKIKKSK